MESRSNRLPRHSTNGFLSREAKASILSTYTLDNVLGLKFSKNDADRYGMNLKQWIEERLAPKLKDYMASTEVKKLENQDLLLRAHLVVIVGSRHILMWDVNSDGELVDWPYLAAPLSQVKHLKQEASQNQPLVRRRAARSQCRCSLCNSLDHDARKCPQRTATMRR